MKICKKCGELNSNEAVFCRKCGEKDFDEAQKIACPECGTLNEQTSVHCTKCGMALTAVAVRSGNGYLSEEQTVVASDEATKCPSCGAELPINAVFCYKCGTSVSALNLHKTVRRKICPHCGKPNLSNAPYCIYCYRSLADADYDDMQLTYQNVAIGNGVTIKKAFLDGINGKSKICGACGALNPVAEHFCINCGCKLDAEPEVQYCPACGAENPSDSTYCLQCQSSFDGTSAEEQQNGWICRKCSKLNDVASKFCTFCGAKNRHKRYVK